MRLAVAAVLVTDLVDSTALVRALGDLRAAELGAEHDARARAAFQAHGGREIDKSDGFLVLFHDVGAAVRCALAYHQVLVELSRAEAVGLQARAGVHLGEVVLRDNPPEAVARGAKPLEVEGLTKVVAARLMALSGGGRTLLSAAATLQARRELDGQDLRWTSHGPWTLKGAGEFEVHEVSPAGAPEPPPLTGSEKAWRPGAGADLPDDGVLVGRREDVARLQARLEDGARLITLLGPAGTGKTRLAVRLARITRASWPGGAWFCDLSGARDLEGLCAGVARGLGVPLGEDDPVEHLGHVLSGRGRALVVLDTLEQVLDPAARALPAWLLAAPQVAFLATSRELLRLSAEEVHPLPPLPVPTQGDDVSEIAASPAVVLFVARARAVDPSFQLTDENAEAIGEIVRRLDGIPLALELAAARVAAMSPAEILVRMASQLDLLKSGRRDQNERHATLRAAIEWSWSLLQPDEKAVLAQASVFHGSFTLAEAEAVIVLPAGVAHSPIADLVATSREKSLLRVNREEAGPRFALYESVREYACEVLKEDPIARLSAKLRHGACFAALGQPEALAALRGAHSTAARRRLSHSRLNLLAACNRAIERGDAAVALPCATAMLALAEAESPFAEALGLAARAAQLKVDPGRPALLAARARLHIWGSQVARDAGHPKEAAQTAAIAREIAEQLGDRVLIVEAMAQQGVCLAEAGALDQALALQQAGLTLAQAAGDRWMAARLTELLAISHERKGQIPRAHQRYQEALAAFQALGDARMTAHLHKDMGDFHRIQGDLEAARQATTLAIEQAQAVGDRRVTAVATGNLAEILLEQGQVDPALEQAGHALRLLGTIGARVHAAHLQGVIAEIHARKGDLAQARELLDRAEQVLAKNPATFLYAVLLIRRALVERLAGQGSLARATLARGLEVGGAYASGPQSEVGRARARLEGRILGGEG